jgi:positive regulator of sigma E activity
MAANVAEHGTPTTKTFGATTVGERGQQVAAPTSTEEEDRVSQGQRIVNLIWETTQMRVALSVIWSALFVSVALAVFGKYLGSPDIQLAAVVFMFGVANLVTGFYFGRTNHQKIGGVEQGR